MVVRLRPAISASGGGDPARHAEMQQQHAAVVELDQDVLAAPAELADAGAVEPLGEIGGNGRRRSGRRNSARDDAAAAHAQREAAADGLDFGKLGHAQAGSLARVPAL